MNKELEEIVGNGKPTGSVLKETIAISVTVSISVQNRHSRILLRALLRVPCKDYFKGTCTNSSCEKWHPPECLFYKSETGCRFGEKCSYAHRQVEEQLSKRSKKKGDKSAVAMLKRKERHQRTGRPVLDAYSSNTRQLGCVFQDMEPTNPTCDIHKSRRVSVILISVAPMLQNLRIGLRKRQNGKSDVPVKQRGGWPKISLKN